MAFKGPFQPKLFYDSIIDIEFGSLSQPSVYNVTLSSSMRAVLSHNLLLLGCAPF